jgi:acyl carrier protein
VTTSDRQARVLSVIANVIEVNPSTIQTDRLLLEYGLDSARVMDLVVALEDEFGVSIPDDVARNLRSVDDIVRFITAQEPA